MIKIINMILLGVSVITNIFTLSILSMTYTRLDDILSVYIDVNSDKIMGDDEDGKREY